MGSKRRRKKNSSKNLLPLKISSLEGILLQTLKVESMRPSKFKTLCLPYNAIFFLIYWFDDWFHGLLSLHLV
jgi:hypothetical protein